MLGWEKMKITTLQAGMDLDKETFFVYLLE